MEVISVTSNMEATQVIGSLNSKVVDYCVENIVSELKQHDNYIKDTYLHYRFQLIVHNTTEKIQLMI